MKPKRFSLTYLTPLLSAVMATAALGGVPLWNHDTRTLALGGAEGEAWLVEGAAQIRLTGGPVISTRDPRYKISVAQTLGGRILTGVDEQQAFDWELVVSALDTSSVRLDWTIINRGEKALQLDRIDVLTGKLTGAVDPAKNRALTSGLHSWDGGEVTRMTPGTKLESHYTLALQSPPLAAGFLAGRHNLDRFQLTQGAAGLEFTAYGECNQCVVPPGGTRAADPLFLSFGGHPLRQMEVFADLAARENGVQLWPENFATWCSWYAGWMRQEPLYEFQSGLEKGVETNITFVSKLLGTRGTPSMRVVDDSNEMPYGDAIFSYEAAAARWFYNWRVWINDPDAIVCRRYGESKSVEWGRCWMSWMALAGRPLDLWENEPYLLWGMDPGPADGAYTLFGIFEFQAKRAGQKIQLNLDEVAARSRSWEQKPQESPATWLLWDFWRQKLTKVSGSSLALPVPSKSCMVFSLRADLGRPQLLGTSGHFSQGKLETQNITWKPRQGSLAGKVRGNGGEPTILFFHVPDGMTCQVASLAYAPVAPKIVEPGVLAVEVPAVGGDPVQFELRFSGAPEKPAMRPFIAGPVGEVTP